MFAVRGRAKPLESVVDLNKRMLETRAEEFTSFWRKAWVEIAQFSSLNEINLLIFF